MGILLWFTDLGSLTVSLNFPATVLVLASVAPKVSITTSTPHQRQSEIDLQVGAPPEAGALTLCSL